jgi:signal transduction histidine kinase/ActR/RegA family two-component response regulator
MTVTKDSIASPRAVPHERASVEASFDPRLFRALEQLWNALFDDTNVDGFLDRALRVVLDATGLEVGAVRLRENGRLRTRAAAGLEQELSSGFSMSVEDEPAAASPPPHDNGGAPFVSAVGMDAPCVSPCMLGRGVETLYRVPLATDTEVFGVLYLGAIGPYELAPGDRKLMHVLATRMAAAFERLASRRALVEAVSARDQLLSVVAHDLRNPMNAISIAAHGLLQRFEEPTARRPLERILRGVQRADRMISDLLEITAIEEGRFVITPSRVDVEAMIYLAVESQQSLAAGASVIIGADMSPDLPRIDADEERVLEVLENLVSNAVKFTAAGGTVTIGASARHDEVLIWVKDNGSGMSPEHLPRLFDRFWQAKRSDRRGIGLGLTICKAIVEGHGGRIWAESAVGAGTTVYFTIPSASDRRGRERPAETVNILMVDDRPENLLSLETILQRPDYRLLRATSGEEALRLALRERIAVALIDVAMPGMNGFEVAAHLKELERSRDIPIIFITAFGNDPQEIHRAYSAGGADYLVKPLDVEIVRKKVAVFAGLSRRRAESDRAPPKAP